MQRRAVSVKCHVTVPRRDDLSTESERALMITAGSGKLRAWEAKVAPVGGAVAAF